MDSYTLTETEINHLKSLQAQQQQAEQMIQQRQADILAIKGGINATLQLIAVQQGLTGETLSIKDGVLSVTNA